MKSMSLIAPGTAPRWRAQIVLWLLFAMAFAGCAMPPAEAGPLALTLPATGSANYEVTARGGAGMAHLTTAWHEGDLRVTIEGVANMGSRSQSLNGTAWLDDGTGALTRITPPEDQICFNIALSAGLCIPPPTELYLHGPQRWIPGSDFPYADFLQPWVLPVGASWIVAQGAGSRPWGEVTTNVVTDGEAWQLTAKAPCFQGCGYRNRDAGTTTMILHANGTYGSLFPTDWHVKTASGTSVIKMTLVEAEESGAHQIELRNPDALMLPALKPLPAQWLPAEAPGILPNVSLQARQASLYADPTWLLYGSDASFLTFATTWQLADQNPPRFRAWFMFDREVGTDRDSFTAYQPIRVGGNGPETWDYRLQAGGGNWAGQDHAYFVADDVMTLHLQDLGLPAVDVTGLGFSRSSLVGELGSATVSYNHARGTHIYSLAGALPLEFYAA